MKDRKKDQSNSPWKMVEKENAGESAFFSAVRLTYF